jgi:hypothetical protein
VFNIMKKIWSITLSLMLTYSLFLISGCQKVEEKAMEVKDKAVETAAGYDKMATPSGADLRNLIFEQMPYEKWALWPGKGKLYEGTEPHGDFITVYVNDIALESIKNAKGMANNSIVLKENYNADKQLTSLTVMKKVKGYNTEGGDWFWVRFGPDSKVTAEGKVQMCQDCHADEKDNDYIFTGKVTAKGAPTYTPGKSAPGYGAPGYGKPGKEAAPSYSAPGYGTPGYGKPGKSAPGYK